MQKLEIDLEPIERAVAAGPVQRYEPGKMGYDLEQYLFSRGLVEIGTLAKATAYAAEDKLLGIDLTYERRCWRSWYVKTMIKTREQLAHWHAIELPRWEFMDFFRVRDRLGLRKDDETQVKFDEHFLRVLHDYNAAHMPPPRRWREFAVPAYFYYDVEFDGMAFHHALDFCVFEGEPLDFGRFGRGKNSMVRELE